ncbi:MAG: nucleotidyltransferase family protein [Deltaproteobacteria bacterium]|nr:nucleotidyltransferase family protein [Deltaproteobacteria bacterium]
MKAMILAAGFGTRLGKITEETPKCLLTAGSKTMLEHTVERLKRAGINEVVINLHHLASQVEQFVRAKDYFGIKVEFSYEENILGTGGGIKQAAPFFKGESSFLVHNADIYTDLCLQELITYHNARDALATLVAVPPQTDSCLCVDESGDIRGLVNSATGMRDLHGNTENSAPMTFIGIHMASTRIFDFLNQEEGAFSFFTPYLKAIRAGYRLTTFPMTEVYWIDMGTEEKLKELQIRLAAE